LGDLFALLPTDEAQQATRHAAQTLDPDALCLIQYTRTLEGDLLGATFDQGQLVKMLHALDDWFSLDGDDLAFTTPHSWNELPHLLATLHYVAHGVANALAPGDETDFSDLQHISPTLTVTPPYTVEYIYEQVMGEIETMHRTGQTVFQWALAVAKEYHAAGLNAGPELREQYQRADMTFFSTIRGMIGGRLGRLILTGAPLARAWSDFAEAIGLLPLNVYSVTEAGGFPTASRPNMRRAGSCGRIIPGYQIRIADDGEILVRGETVMRGYWRNPVATRQALDADGWFHTGDLGRFDSDGYLFVTGHKRAHLMLGIGRRVDPAAFEREFTAYGTIAQALVAGEGRRYLSALLVPNLPAVQAALASAGKPVAPLSIDDPHLLELMGSIVQAVNQAHDGSEQIERFSLLEASLADATGQPITEIHQHRKLLYQLYADRLADFYPVVEPFGQQQVTQVQVEPEQLRQLLEKEDILDAWMDDAGISFLLELARAKQIDVPAMVHICETITAIAQMQNEERPLSTALIVGNPTRIGRILPESALQLRQYDHIRRMRRIITSLARIVDGRVLGFSMDKHGFVRGIHRLEVPLEQPGSDLTGVQFRHLAAISHHCDAVIFSIPSGGRQVRVFADGQLVGRYANGAWISENMGQIDAAVVRLAENKALSPELLQRLVRCAFKLSERNLGAILLVGDAEAILRRSDKAEIQNVAAVSIVPVTELSDEELIAFARQDGATVVDSAGELRGCMVLLRPAAATQAQVGPGKGARHSSAAKMSAETNCIAITISQDGPIAIYDNGQRVLSL
jgi:long-chain acyl-CoA synthetase